MTDRIPSWRRHYDDLRFGDLVALRCRVGDRMVYGRFLRFACNGKGLPWFVTLLVGEGPRLIEWSIGTEDVAGINRLTVEGTVRADDCDRC